MIHIRNILLDILKETYILKDDKQTQTEDSLRRRVVTEENQYNLEKFYIDFPGTVTKSRHGSYNAKLKKITIYNTYREDALVLCTTLHELAHHCDYVLNHNLGHNDSFYKEFERLLYVSMDMGLLKKEDILSANRDATDYNKICKILHKYHPCKLEYKKDIKTISVENSYICKNELKERDYYFNGINKTWDIDTEDVESEIVFLETLKEKYKDKNITYKIKEATDIHFDGVNIVVITVSGNTYPTKDILSKLKYKYDGKKQTWTKSVDKDALDAHLHKLKQAIGEEKNIFIETSL